MAMDAYKVVVRKFPWAPSILTTPDKFVNTLEQK